METRWRREGLGFLEERYENSSFLHADADMSRRFGLKMGQGGRVPKLGLIGVSPCSADHGWVPVGPSFLWSIGRARDVIIIVGSPALLAYMALN